ncbi:MAG: HEAT repeat domain-containing protein [Chloroflexota bacterium]
MSEHHVPFQTVVETLLEGSEFPRRYLQHFSDLDPASLRLLMQAWPQVKPARKRALLKQLEATLGKDTLVSYDDLAYALLEDPESSTRRSAIRLLAECENPKLVPAYARILANDEDPTTRAEAATALGHFVMLGELEEIPQKFHRQAEDALLQAANSQPDENVCRAAVESLGFSSRPETPTLIEAAFRRSSHAWRASALVAMGRSNDDRWQEPVIGMLLSENLHERLSAVQAAGELGLDLARPLLIRLLEDEEDDDISAAAIWALSQIGGEDARTYLESLLDSTEDEAQLEFLEEALENLDFTEDLERFDLLAFDPDLDDE